MAVYRDVNNKENIESESIIDWDQFTDCNFPMQQDEQQEILKQMEQFLPSHQITPDYSAKAAIQTEPHNEVFGVIPISYQNAQNVANVLPLLLTEHHQATADYLLPSEIDYQRDFLIHFRQREHKFRPKPHYLKHQAQIDHAARASLVDWLASVVDEWDFDTEVLYLAVSYVDRFLSKIMLTLDKLQLIGITAVYVAVKYEQIRKPAIVSFACIGGVEFDTKQIVKMERLLLSTLSYDMRAPTSYSFTIAHAELNETPDILKYLTLYICELSLMEADPYLKFLPSQISAASHALARYILGYPIWSKELEEFTYYRPEDLKEIVLHLCQTHYNATVLAPGATKMKFMDEEFHQVALIGSVSIDAFIFDQFINKYNLFY